MTLESEVSRRDFLKGTVKYAAVGLAGAVGFAVIQNEVNKGKEGIVRVGEGNFIPLYEAHPLGVSPEKFPQSLDALFREIAWNLGEIEENMKINSDYSTRAMIGGGAWTEEDKIISNLAENNSPVVFGDISLNKSPRISGFIEIGATTFEVYIGYIALLVKHKLSEKEGQNNLTRRKFLNLGLATVALFGLSNSLELLELLGATENPDWAKRIVRIAGMTSHMHPEKPLTFLRNAVMANKLLLVGNHLKEKLGRQPNIAFWVGAGHSGIEDFLQAGPDFCRKVIAAYPDFYLRPVINANRSAEDFSSALLVYLHKESNGKYSSETLKITDTKLVDKLPH